MSERGRGGLDERGGCLGGSIGQAGRDLGPPREGCDVERADGGAGLEEGHRDLGGAARKPGQPEADAGPFAETLLAEALLQRACRFGERLVKMVRNAAKLSCVALDQLGGVAHDARDHEGTASLLEDGGDDLFDGALELDVVAEDP
jgi:hypothetical protein